MRNNISHIIAIVFTWVNLNIALNVNAQNLPTATSGLFSGSGNCALCHIAGIGVFMSQDGADISPTTLWCSTMMANAAKDPLWQAKVTAEVNAHPALQAIIEDKCTTCHTPMGRAEAIYTGATHFSFDEAMADILSLDGVSCTLCHQIQQENLGSESSFSGGYEITDAHHIFGPYQFPMTMPMFNQVGYLPVYSDHVNSSQLCATCHTLFTPYVDNQGQVAGYFPEQTPYQEWKNSIYPENEQECQTCHLPALHESMKISVRPPTLSTLRTPIWTHDFVGANIFMNNVLTEYSTEIGVTASESNLGYTKNKTVQLLKDQTVNLFVEAETTADTLEIAVTIENLAGHKFPTGFPSRQAWLHLFIKNQNDKIVFESGNWNSDGEIAGIDDGFEHHHQIINVPNQVQVYQAIMQDVDSEVTFTLLRGASYIKDNRLPPKGFVSTVDNFDDIAIVGNATNDPDFNRDETGTEGTGSDIVYYRMPVDMNDSEYEIHVELCYQTMSSAFAKDLFSYQTDKVTRFKQFFDGVENTPVVLQSVTKKVNITDVKSGINTEPETYGLRQNYPNPFNPSTTINYSLAKDGHVSLVVYNVLGEVIAKLVDGLQSKGSYNVNWNAHNQPGGLYFYRLKTDGFTATRKMILQQ